MHYSVMGHPGRELILYSLTIFFAMLVPSPSSAQHNCVEPEISDQRIREIVQELRTTRSDLPKKLPDYRWEVGRDGCYYVYVEYPLPEVPHNSQAIVLNQHGVIVDARAGALDQSLQCPEKVLSEEELTATLEKERDLRSDLPQPYADYEIHLQSSRCLHLYFEYKLPRRRGDYIVFTIDPYGEIMGFSRSDPY